MKNLLCILFCILLIACTKNEQSKDPYIGNIEILSSKTVQSATVGENITSKVKLVIPSSNGFQRFQGFEITENPVKIFSIRGKAWYQNTDIYTTSPVYFEFDTTLLIKTSISGQHILKFYNNVRLLKSDTVNVF